MDALALLQDQASNTDDLLIRVVTPEQGAWLLPGSTANTIGATFLHTYYSEDELVHRFLGTRSEFEEGGWQQRLGYDPDASWTLDTKPETSLLLSYAAAVFAATKHYLTGLAPEALELEVETQRGRRRLASRLAGYLVSHKLQHTGEISALLGCQGLKGLP